MSRLTRHEILKEDKFLLTVDSARDFFLAKQKQILMALGIGGVVLLVVLGGRYYLAQQDESAKDQLSAALRTYHGTVLGATPGTPNSPEPVFATSTEKYEKALGEFQKVASQYSSRPSGKIAKYYAGLSLRELNRTNEAIATLEALGKDASDYGVLAQRALVSIYEGSGNLAKASEISQQLAQSKSAVVSKSETLMHLAQLYEQQNKKAEATKVYQQLVKDFPGTSTMTEAEQKLKQLSQ